MKPYLQYANDVVDGNIVVGEYIRLACQRFLNDLQREDLYFDEAKVDRAIRFIQSLKHYTGKHAGKPFILEPWQSWIVANLVGLYNVEDGKPTTRKYKSSYIEVSRKNGKTFLASALCLYFFLADGEPAAQCILAANSKGQSKIAFTMCSTLMRQLDPKSRYTKSYRDNILFGNSELKVIAADDSKLDGMNCSFYLLDEFHAAKNSKVRDVLKSSMSMRYSPLECIITTAGFDKTGPCFLLRTTATEVLSNIKQDDSLFAAIYSLDNNDAWDDPTVWAKATPNIGITVNEKFIEDQINSAKNNPSEEVGVKTKTLNVWCDSFDVWIPENYIVGSSKQIDLLDGNYEDQVAYVGVDLSSVSDMTAVSVMIPRFNEDTNDTTYYFKNHYYLPESALVDGVNKEMYKYWKLTKQINITSGNVVDYDYITNDLMKYYNGLNIHKVAYDAYNSTQWAITATELGLPLEPYSQSIGNFNKPTRELERLLLSGKVVIDNNEITRWMFRNVCLKVDHNGNIKPNKGVNTTKKIDGVISMIQALGVYLETPQYSSNILSI